MRLLIIGLILSLLMLAAGCETMETTGIGDIARDAGAFINKTVIVLGTFSKEMSSQKNEFGGHYTAYLKDFQDYKIRFVCEDLDKLGQNKRYLVNGTVVYNNQTSNYYLRCKEPPVEK
ncbi:MAG: hypothetical protein V1866_01895 [archaeon]